MSAASLRGTVHHHEARLHRGAALLTAIALAALTGAWVGCSSPQATASEMQPAKPPPLGKATSASGKPAVPGEDPQAAQARRDLEEWDKLRKQKQAQQFAADGGAVATAPAAPPLSTEQPPPVIVWNDSNGGVSIVGSINTKLPEAAAQPDRSRMPTVSLTPGDAPARSTSERSLGSATGPGHAAAPTTTPSSLTANAAAASASAPAAPPADGLAISPPPALPSDEAARLQLLLVQLSRELYQQSTYEDTPLRELIVIAATTMVSSERQFNADALPGLTDRERQLLAEMHQFFIDLGEKLKTSGDPEVIPAAVESLRARLKVEPDLQLVNATLASSVEGFGKVRPFEPARFLAHSEQKVIVYVEVDKFASEVNEQGEYVTELAQQLVIYGDRDGIPLWQEDWQTAVDRTRAKRNDFFMRQIVTLPKALSVGPYHLKVRVRDRKSGAEAEASIPFEMVADPKMAATVQ